MLQFQKRFNQLCRQITLFVLVGFMWLISLPTISAQADAYFSQKADRADRVETNRPYYSTKVRRGDNDPSRPYYANKERQKDRATNLRVVDDNYPDYEKRIGEDRLLRDTRPGDRRRNP